MFLKFLLIFSLGCTKAWTTSIDLGGVVSGNRMAAVPLGRTVRNGIVDIEGVCAQSGVACQNCTHVVTCVQLPGGWLKIPLLGCPEGTTCNAHLGKCSNVSVPECDTKTQSFRHSCEQVGIFPDAFDCRKFHLCSPPEDLPDGQPADRRTALCPRHYGYNPQTAQCSIKLQNGQCTEKPVPDCLEIGQTGALPSSPNHYYMCLSKNGNLYPQVFICPNGWFFNNAGFCTVEQTIESTTEKKEENEGASKEVNVKKVDEAAVRATTSKIELFFSTEKPTTYPPDTFLADKFDLSNYEQIQPDQQTNDDLDFDQDGGLSFEIN